MTEQYTPGKRQVRMAWIKHRWDNAGQLRGEGSDAEFDRFIARVRRDAVQTLAETISADALEQARAGNDDGADFYHIVAREIEKHIPEEAPYA